MYATGNGKTSTVPADFAWFDYEIDSPLTTREARQQWYRARRFRHGDEGILARALHERQTICPPTHEQLVVAPEAVEIDSALVVDDGRQLGVPGIEIVAAPRHVGTQTEQPFVAGAGLGNRPIVKVGSVHRVDAAPGKNIWFAPKPLS